MLRSCFIALLAVPPVAGCGALDDLLSLNQTVVRLVNNADFDVRATLYFHEQQDLPRDVLTEVGTRVELTLAPGETRSFSRACEELQAIVIDNAELRVIGGVGPNASSEVQRDGDDFDCAAVLTFTFDHSGAISDFNVTVSVEKR